MYNLPAYVWTLVLIGVIGIPATTCLMLYRGAWVRVRARGTATGPFFGPPSNNPIDITVFDLAPSWTAGSSSTGGCRTASRCSPRPASSPGSRADNCHAADLAPQAPAAAGRLEDDVSGFYRVAYALGFRPWGLAGQQAKEQFESLPGRETGQRPAPPGHAVDLGCGTGARTIELASRGWRAVGVDNQPRALRIARARAAACEADVTFVRGDVTSLRPDDIGTAADFLPTWGAFTTCPGRPARPWPPPSRRPRHGEPRSCCSPSLPADAGRCQPERARKRSRQPSTPGRSSPTNPPTPRACRARYDIPPPRWYRLGLRPSTPAI